MQNLQSFRRYATESPAVSAGPLISIGALALAGAGGGYYYYQWKTETKKPAAAKGGAPPSASEQHTIPAQTPKSAAFTGGDQGWIDLKLESVEELNHNTKKFRFELPDKDNVSGLQIACTYTLTKLPFRYQSVLTDVYPAAALLTKYKGPEMEKPAIRPYTPTSDEGS